MAFASSAHVGAFVLQLCTAAKERRGSDPRAALVVVKKVHRLPFCCSRALAPAPPGKQSGCATRAQPLPHYDCHASRLPAPAPWPPFNCYHQHHALVQGEEEALFIDPAVYSRNRAFRLYLSSKKGKEVGRLGCHGVCVHN